MEPLYLLGEPICKPGHREKHFAPVSQAELCLEVLRETQDFDTVAAKLREEYLAIAWSLTEMGIDFRIIHAHQNQIDKQVLGVCIQKLGCRGADFSEKYFPPSVIYPRDFAIVLPGVILVNSQVTQLFIKEKDNYKIIPSPYGEGGRVLTSDRTILVSERLCTEEGKSRPAKSRDLEKVTNAGIKVGLLPPPVTQILTSSGFTNRSCFNDHLDRVACLISGRNSTLHLVVDPKIYTAKWRGGKDIPWTPIRPEETLERLKSICEPLGIAVHKPKSLRVPYSLNLLQFPDGRVLMTEGDENVAEVISRIVGEEKLFKTPTPIRFYPVWDYAGIRCLVSEAPLPLFKQLSVPIVKQL